MTIVTGFFVAIAAAFLPVGTLADYSNAGTLFAFAAVSLGVMILRKRDPGRPRPFRTPALFVVAPVSIAGRSSTIRRGCSVRCAPRSVWRPSANCCGFCGRRPRRDPWRRAARRIRRNPHARAKRTAVHRIGRRQPGTPSRRLQIGAHARRTRGVRVRRRCETAMTSGTVTTSWSNWSSAS